MQYVHQDWIKYPKTKNFFFLFSWTSGGEDFDQRVMEHFIKLYKKKKGKDVRKDNRAVQKLRREVEKAKRALSSQHQTRIEIESFFDGEDFSETLTRARFEELNMVSTAHQSEICSIIFVSSIQDVFVNNIFFKGMKKEKNHSKKKRKKFVLVKISLFSISRDR